MVPRAAGKGHDLPRGARLGSSGTPDPRLPHLLPNEIRSPIDKHRLLI